VETGQVELVERGGEEFPEFAFGLGCAESGDQDEGGRLDAGEEGLHGCVDDGGGARLGSAPQRGFFEEVAERWVVDKGSVGHVSRMDRRRAACTDLPRSVAPNDSRKWQRSARGWATIV
jgi:hypothetical protein